MSSPVRQSKSFNEICNISVYYMKFLFYGVSVTFFSTLLVIPYIILRIGHYSSTTARITRKVTDMISHVLGIKWSLKGTENVLTEDGAIIAMNHQSALDLLALGVINERKICTGGIMKTEIWYLMPPVAAFMCLNGIISIDRFNKIKGFETLNKVSNEIAKNKARILIFPEGTRHDGNKLLPFKKGAFHSAIAAQVPIVPVVTRRYTFLDHKNRRFHSGEGLISVLPPIPTVGLKQENVQELMLKVHEIMSKEYDDLNSADQNLFPLSEKVK